MFFSLTFSDLIYLACEGVKLYYDLMFPTFFFTEEEWKK